MMIKNNKTIKNRGYVLMETLFYICFFAIFSILVINVLILMTKAFRETTIQAEFMQGGNIMERMSREIRQAYEISSIGVNNLKLNIKQEDDSIKTVEFLLSGANVQIKENDVLKGNLNTPNIQVLALSFNEITTMNGKAIKVFLTVKSNSDNLNRTEDFYDTIILRGSY